MAVNTLAYLSQAQPYKSGTVPDPMAMLSNIETLKQKEQATELGEKKLADYEEDRQRKWQLEKAEAGRAAAKEADEKITRHLDIRKNAMDWAERLLPKMDYDDYPTFYQEAIANRIDESALPHPKDIKSPEDWTNARADMEAAIRKGRELLGKDTEAVSQIRRWRDEQQAGSTESFLEFKVREKKALETVKEDKAPTTAMAKFIKDHPDATDTDLIKFSQALKGKGVRLTLSDGTVVEVGGGIGADMTPKTKGTIEEKLLGGKEQLARMKTIASEFKPEFQEIGTRLGTAWTGMKAKMGQDVPEEDKQQLIEFKGFQRKSIENINLYIKEMTGAQMSEKEADRLRLAQPDPGEKWYKGDDPITFKAKMDDVIKGARAAVARYEYYRTKGLSDAEIKGLVNSDQAVSLESIMEGMK